MVGSVFIRGRKSDPANVNDTNQEVNVKVGNVATTNQLLDVADVRCRGVWIYQGGAVAPGDPPVGLQRFLMTDKDGIKTQEYSEAVSLTVHAMGAGQMDKVSIGETEIGDLITIQNTRDLGGGSYIVTAIEEFGSDNPDELTDTYAVYTVEPDAKRCSGNVATEEKAVLRIIPQQAVPAFEDEYLPLTGGTIEGSLACTRPGQTAAGTYIFSVKASGLEEGKQVAFRVTADGAVKAGHDTGHPFMASAKNDVVTKKYLDDQIAAIPKPEIPEVSNGPTTEYDGNRYCKNGVSTTVLETGDVMFLNDQLVSEQTPSKIVAIALPIDEFDWDKCAKSGIIKANNGSKNAGYYQVYDLKEMEGRNMRVYVKPLVVDDSVRHEEGGAPCYFHGVFFG